MKRFGKYPIQKPVDGQKIKSNVYSALKNKYDDLKLSGVFDDIDDSAVMKNVDETGRMIPTPNSKKIKSENVEYLSDFDEFDENERIILKKLYCGYNKTP